MSILRLNRTWVDGVDVWDAVNDANPIGDKIDECVDQINLNTTEIETARGGAVDLNTRLTVNTTIQLTGDIVGEASFDGSGDITINTKVFKLDKYEEIKQITSNDATDYEYFGRACSLSADGSILAICSNMWVDTYTNQGCVHIYDWDGSNWVQRSQITNSDAAGYFGSSCSLSSDGSILAVGAAYWIGTYTNQGCVYIYDWDGSNWVQRSQITASDARSYVYFGSSCSLNSDGSVLAVGSNKWEGTYASQGCVYIYDWDGSNWVQRSQITASDANNRDQFGWSCSLSSDGSALAVGAHFWDGTYTDQGCVYIFDWNGSNWIQRSQIIASDATSDDQFGSSCSLSADGSILAVGANLWAGTYYDQGCVYIYDWDGSNWVQRSQITASDAAYYDNFGVACSLSSGGSILAVGSRNWDGTYTDQGCVYIFV